MPDQPEPVLLADGLLKALCKAYAQLMRRQRTASAAFVTWQRDTRRSHEFAWLGGAFDRETLMRDGRELSVTRQSLIFDSVQKMHATAQLNPYEREILYGYPYVVGRMDGRAIRAPLFTIAVTVSAEGPSFGVRPDDEVVRFNTLPFRAEADTAAREQALQRLLARTPSFPLGRAGASEFATELGRELPEVAISSILDGRLSAPPVMPNSGSYLELIDQAALFVAPKTGYFLTSDLESISGAEDQRVSEMALAALIAGAGSQAQAEFEPDAEDAAPIYYPFPSNRSQRRVALLVDDPTTRVVRVEGPPGTGKSLTIANLACHLVATGRTVLITSQKDKALEVVDTKLRELGLPQLPMTLLRHDPASKQELRDRLDRIEKTRPAKEAEEEVNTCQEQFADEKDQYLALKVDYASALRAEHEYEITEHAAETARGLRRLAASWRFRNTRRRLARRVPLATDELAEEATDQREQLLQVALSALKAAAERLTSTAQRNERQQLREFSRLLRRDQSSYRNFSVFDRLKTQPERAAMLLRILPVWIMTPDDVARLFPCQPGVFDVVIVDEASQVDLPSITPILYRANKVVICGDPRQMHARRFAFTQQQIALEAWIQHGMNARDPDSWLQPTKQSLLDLAFVRAEEENLLDEHFRCLPPIISFSNNRWYGGRLRIMTDETRKRFGDPHQPIIELHHVEQGVISNGSQENEAEADALVCKLKDLLLHPAYGEATFGVMCLFEEQVRLVQELVAEQIAPELWEAHDLIVVNPDGFQGDERDVILYSLSFDNRLMNRAALSARQANQEHVQGMLNVGFTRARDEIHIFHSAPISDFTFADGSPGALTDWLAHCARAQTQPRQQPRGSRLGRSDSQFEGDVAAALRHRGYTVTQQYPSCGFLIDLVVECNGDRLAVECDGEFYHHDEHGHLKFEDLERQAVLERAGWQVLRIPYRRWREQAEVQLARVEACFNPSPGDEEDGYDDGDEAQGTEEGTSHPVRVLPGENAIIQALKQGLREEEQVLRHCRDLLGHRRLGNVIRAQLQNSARALQQRGLIAVEDGEYFLTQQGRSAEPQVWEPQTYTRPRQPRRRYYQPTRRQMYTAVCSECGGRAEVPFRPRSGWPVYCRSCYARRRARR